LAEPKAPEEMRYAELGRYIDALVRSGGDARKLAVDRALKIAVPVTCLIITIFAAPLAITGPRASATFGIAISLATTILFLTLIQLSRAIGSGGLVPPTLAAWMPNLLFGAIGLWLLKKAPT
jgi:lipopolysaccharide export system permease protein